MHVYTPPGYMRQIRKKATIDILNLALHPVSWLIAPTVAAAALSMGGAQTPPIM